MRVVSPDQCAHVFMRNLLSSMIALAGRAPYTFRMKSCRNGLSGRPVENEPAERPRLISICLRERDATQRFSSTRPTTSVNVWLTYALALIVIDACSHARYRVVQQHNLCISCTLCSVYNRVIIVRFPEHCQRSRCIIWVSSVCRVSYVSALV